MTIPFATFFDRFVKATGISTQMALAEALGVNRSAITQAKARNAVPQKWILALARRYALSPDWLEFGTGAPRPRDMAASAPEAAEGQADSTDTAARLSDKDNSSRPILQSPVVAEEEGELVYVPQSRALLCAGGGSFEVDASPVARYPFPRRWLSRMGRPEAMVFMEVVGDSMEPGIMDGDLALVDRSLAGIVPHAVLAVGFEDAIYLKRVTRQANGLVLRSDNKAYADMRICGDELDSFRLIGKVVWLCRQLG